jgi:hypothetical protein
VIYKNIQSILSNIYYSETQNSKIKELYNIINNNINWSKFCQVPLTIYCFQLYWQCSLLSSRDLWFQPSAFSLSSMWRTLSLTKFSLLLVLSALWVYWWSWGFHRSCPAQVSSRLTFQILIIEAKSQFGKGFVHIVVHHLLDDVDSNYLFIHYFLTN